LRESLWFVKCSGEADLSRLGTVLRAGMIVSLSGAGSLHSGNYLVWSVRHTIKPDSYKMKFQLVRDAVGAAGGADGLTSAAGQAAGAL